jgi:hypothetical protein
MIPLKRFALLIFLAVSAVLSAGDIAAVSDDSALRSEIELAVLRAPTRSVLGMRPSRRTLPDGTRVELRVERGAAEYMIVLAREKDGSFPVSASGGWALYRRLSDGEPTRIRMFPSSDPHCYVQLRPDGGGRTLMDSVVYGGYVGRAVVLPLPFDRAVTAPFASLVKMAGPQFPRRYFEPFSAQYADIRDLTAAIRSRLGELTYVDDGAFDENGLPVYIETGAPQGGTAGVNCSGFAKWLADGLLRPLGLGRLPIEPLKVPPVSRGHSFSEPFDDARDPYFGLDWTRNLAAAVGRAYFGERGADPGEYEVRSSPIAAVRIPGGDGSAARAYPKQMKDSGFALDGLKATLYALAVDEPGRIYLASVNRDIGTAPRLRQHYHVAAFLPQFDESGTFSIAVFESGVESDFDAFIARYQGHLIHLVRLPAEKGFDP